MSNSRPKSISELAKTLQIVTAVLLPALSLYALFEFSDEPKSLARQAGLLVAALSTFVFALLMFQHARISALEEIVANLNGKEKI